MSAVEPCLETKEIPETNELMESFVTVDEDKDSDEESFHLFLEGDEDHNRSEEKITDEFDLDTITENKEESGSTNPDSVPDESIASHPVGIEEKQKDDVSLQTTLIPGEETNENIGKGEEQCTTDHSENKHSENGNSISDPNNTNDSNEDVSEIENSALKTSDDIKLGIDVSSENEDDILNNHDSENTEELGNTVDELDPNIEESLLNDCDDHEDNSKKTSEYNTEESAADKSQTNTETASAIKQTEVSGSVVDEEKDNPPVPDISEKSDSVDRSAEIKENPDKNSNSANPPKCDDNSNSSNPDTEDLLDISMIKDSAQDDADIAEDALQLEQECDDSSSKGVENVETMDDLSNSENSDEEGKAESEAFENIQNELSDSEKEKELQGSDKEEPENKNDEGENGDEGMNNHVSQEICEEKKDKPSKRNLSSDDLEPASKRIRLVDTSLDDVEIDSWDITDLQSLISFSKFMTKSHLKRLTRADLEEFCVQKLCEAILHKSELGETNHQLKIQEQTIETLRRDQAVLTKQIKDLEIVNKKLMHEILASNGLKPIVPVKITRSVGLQVRLPAPNDPNAAKRRSLPTPHKIPGSHNQVPPVKARTPSNTTPNRTIMQPSPQKQPTPILNQVLQNRNRTPVKTPQNNAVQRTNIPQKPAPPPEKRQRTSGSFIDLTDEDDKRMNNKNVKSNVPQGVRINSVPKTTVQSVLPSVVSTTTPQLMYVVQPNSQLKQGVLTTSAGQKAVLVNFQPTNGVINTLNSSSVSVIPKIAGNLPLKPKSNAQNSILKVNKHPAPLPNPPAVQGPNDKSLKAIPPKPVLSIRKTSTGIILQWRMPYDLGHYETIASYQLYAYQETSAVPSTDMWRKVGDVKAMALPMACTLTQFADKNKYYFAVRPVDIHKRIGKFSHPVLSE